MAALAQEGSSIMPKMLMDYAEYLSGKRQDSEMFGFDPTWLPDSLMDFQAFLTAWSIRKGRAGVFADCGLGKTLMQLVWAENVVRHTNRSVLILTPLAVSGQTAREAAKFGIDCRVSKDGVLTPGINVTNYERLHYFDCSQLAGIVCDESSAIKNFSGSRTKAILDAMKQVEYRMLCTATAAPNDYHELGTSSEALGCLGYRDMLTTFFKEDIKRDFMGWNRTKYRFRGHAEEPFWRWVCSWARAMRKPSDFGFDDSRFQLPPLNEIEEVIENSTPRSGMLFSIPAKGIREEREERRITINERCERVASKISREETAVVWCHLNDEGDLLEKIIPGAVQVHGSLPDDEKEDRLAAFAAGEIKVLVTKPKIGCWGLNWQHCHNIYTFPSHSFEQYYQAVRRCWRFGQQQRVNVTVVATEGEAGIIANIRRKSEQTSRLFSRIVEMMSNELSLRIGERFDHQEELPSWL